ncbi:CRISPR-associated endonuclease Cas1 [Actinomyces oris]|uniref:CRISPR-associated endonuclease Cas1 n=1 Tax=Actinomyces oris TaxID=544580 RepID=A0AAW9KYW2_9ACTO|nr:CRISPR-associated endonuclease Cas1 [Actinomyces oris]
MPVRAGPTGGRLRRAQPPPKDLANAAFSYAYAILLAECTGALLAAGLEPSLGVLHASTDKRRRLSLDLYASGPSGPPRWRVGATGCRSPLSSCGWSPPSSTRCVGRSPGPSTRPTTSSTSTRCATPAWHAARSTGPRPRSTTPGCTEGCGEPAARRVRAAHRRIPPRLRRRPCLV